MAMNLCGGFEIQLQECLDELAQAVVHPLKNGLHSFNNVMKMLLRMERNPYGQITQGYSKIRNEIVNMDQYMKSSQDVALKLLERIDTWTVELTKELTELTNQKKRSEVELQNLKLTLESHKSSFDVYKNSLEKEEGNLKTARDTIERMREKRNNWDKVACGGVLTAVVPVAGWVVGAALVGIGLNQQNKATRVIDAAKEEVRQYESQIKIFSDKVKEYKLKISTENANIERVDKMINTSQNKLQDIPRVRGVIANIQCQFRRAIFQLDQLCNVSSAAELQTRYVVMVKPLVKVMQNMITALGQITTEDLLYSQGITYLMQEIQSNHSKLVQQQQNTIRFGVSSGDDAYQYY